MKKVININLGGLPYIIDEDAYEYLNQYFDSLRRHFSASEGCDEIIYDIELRMSELFQEQLKSKQIITMNELTGVIEIMGKPEDFGAEALDMDAEHVHQQQYSESKFHRTGKKLYRDSENKMLGGVCSGLSAYLGIDDPLWLRILFAISFFVFGVGVLPYILLWIVVPEAKTSADKLAMKGEPINIDNIAKTIETEINDLSDRIHQYSSKYSGKKKMRGQGIATGINNAFGLASNIFLSIITTLVRVAKPLISIILGFVILMLTVGIIAFLVSSFVGHSFLQFFMPRGSFFAALAVVLIILIPVVSIILNLAKWYYPHSSKTYGKYMGMAWGASFVMIFLSAMTTIKHYEASYKETSSYDLTPFDKSKKISLNFDGYYGEGLYSLGNNVRINGEELQMETAGVNLKRSTDGKLRLEEEVSARGATQIEAKTNATRVMHDFIYENGELRFPLFRSYSKDRGFRGESTRYTLYVPDDYKVILPEKRKWKVGYDEEVSSSILTEN